jgi:uncharacterized protein (DUF1330 family)
MVAYLIADTDIDDHKTYDEYKWQVLPKIAKFGGRFLVRGGPHEILEGLERAVIDAAKRR